MLGSAARIGRFEKSAVGMNLSAGGKRAAVGEHPTITEIYNFFGNMVI